MSHGSSALNSMESLFLFRSAGPLLLTAFLLAGGCASNEPIYLEPDGGWQDGATQQAEGGVAGTGGTSGGGTGGSTVLPDGGISGTGGVDGSSGTGGEGGGGGTAGSAGASGSAADAGCVPYDGPPLVDVSVFDQCTLCDNAHCVPLGFLSIIPQEDVDRLADCDSDHKCVPDMYMETGNLFVAKTCSSINGAEGRCLSLCVPEVKEREGFIPRDICNDDELCAPCYDPITGEDMGSCRVGCDTGPAEEPYVFDECCGGISVCAPTDVVPADQRPSLDRGECSSSTDLCVPREAALDPDGYVPEHCESWMGAEARCLPDCLPEVKQNAARIEQGTCPDSYLCSPCYDHVSQEQTLACTVAGDPGPTEDPVFFQKCCESSQGSGVFLSACVPLQAIPD
jgi:hypothetical protein